MSGNLDSFVSSSRPPPAASATSQEIRDRSSTFVATIYRASSPRLAREAINHHKNVVHASKPASHEIAAWRCMVLKPGKTGLSESIEDDFELSTGWDDDGERFGGVKILKTMEAEGIIDAVVIVSRWYGGIMLGPARFEHMETCTREVSRTFKLTDELEETITTIRSLDDILADLRREYASLSSSETQGEGTTDNGAEKKRPTVDYSAIMQEKDLKKARRLITARENSIKSVKALIAKKNQ
ncbi:ribosomal protein S5 domain 2-like protein, partial [Punctularia strigosozonata HHB-11173 SS5]|uniref:ribosomal protein S5 domain 2-like protein n=1 Tax=Punctularia strigosozonata (strain HHB-11173) TaxID=741275 RepID=UPI00044178F6